ncbi:MAG: DUF2017 domain-containing protein [Candidatus Nanopelagicales bacterium]
MAVHGFRRSLGGRIVLRADVVERGILTDLVGQLVEFVAPEDEPDADPLARLVGIDPDAERPDDPALARLFPDAYADDDEAAGEFRRFTERSLREAKLANAAVVLDALDRAGDKDKVALSDDEARAWLGTLNDLRLTLGSRLGIDEDSHELVASLAEDDPAFAVFHVYDWLTFLQETLVQALTGLVSEPPPGASL